MRLPTCNLLWDSAPVPCDSASPMLPCRGLKSVTSMQYRLGKYDVFVRMPLGRYIAKMHLDQTEVWFSSSRRGSVLLTHRSSVIFQCRFQATSVGDCGRPCSCYKACGHPLLTNLPIHYARCGFSKYLWPVKGVKAIDRCMSSGFSAAQSYRVGVSVRK